jgi:hypothetical protein
MPVALPQWSQRCFGTGMAPKSSRLLLRPGSSPSSLAIAGTPDFGLAVRPLPDKAVTGVTGVTTGISWGFL